MCCTSLQVALKAMTKEWRPQDQQEGEGEEEEGVEDERNVRSLLARPPSRHSIITGFANVKKELSILFPLMHPHVVKLFGVMLRPMGLVLELAPMGSLKKILSHYQDVHARTHARAMQRTLMQVRSCQASCQGHAAQVCPHGNAPPLARQLHTRA